MHRLLSLRADVSGVGTGADRHMGLALLMHTGLPPAFQALLMHSDWIKICYHKYDKSYPPMPFFFCLLYVMM